jgi:hypothetical protein
MEIRNLNEPVRLIQVGMGPIGCALTPVLHEKRSIRIVGAVDIDPDLADLALGGLTATPEIDIRITGRLEGALDSNPRVAVVTTVSSVEQVWEQIHPIIAAGVNVVSTCEELSYPWKTHPSLAAEMDQAARRAGVSRLGAGVNPGFLMDFLPIALSGVCRRVDSILIERIQDASARRGPFRDKIGAGLSPTEFAKRNDAGKIRHVGLTESMHMVAASLGWKLDHTEDVVEPVLTESDIHGEEWVVRVGEAAGVNQVGRGFCADEEVLTLIFRAAVGQENPRDSVTIRGDPDYTVSVPGGTHGDVATCAIIANAAVAICTSEPGLRTMADIAPIPCAP